MPTSDASWSGRLRLIGELERADHYYLTGDDQCAFFGEYTPSAYVAGPPWKHSSTNQLIHNLKKSPSKRDTAEWPHKVRAIGDCARAIKANLDPDQLGELAIVPIPPSKTAAHPDYDDRMIRVALGIGANVDVRQVLFTQQAREAAHINQGHRDPVALRASLAVRHDLVEDAPKAVVLIDDVLTTGCSFKVCKSMLVEIWPETEVFGLFIARRIIPPIDPAIAFADIEL
jgi:hypothetical protein